MNLRVYFTEASRHGLTYDPLNWAETVIGKITSRFDKEVLDLTIELQGTSNAMNIAVISGARAKKDNVQQMSGAYGQITVNNYRPISGCSVGRPQTQYPKETTPVKPLASQWIPMLKGSPLPTTSSLPLPVVVPPSTQVRVQFRSLAAADLEHKLKRATENLVIDERRYLKNVRTGKVLSTMIGDDGLRPFHPRGPDNMDGLRISLQPFFFGHTCVHGVTLHDECRQCEMESGTKVTMRGRILELPPYIRHIFLETMGERTCNDPASIVTRLYEYYLDSRVEPGEMIGSTGAANVGEPVTQAGLRAFHGGGKGTTPTVERITQLLELAKSEIQQPQTIFYLKEEHDTMENAQAVANFCSILRMGDIIELAEYDDNGSALEIRFDQAVMDTFEVSKSFVTDIINYRGKTQGHNALETADGVRVQYQNTSLMPPRAYLMLMKERLDKLQIHGLVKGACLCGQAPTPDRDGRASRSNRSWPLRPRCWQAQ